MRPGIFLLISILAFIQKTRNMSYGVVLMYRKFNVIGFHIQLSVSFRLGSLRLF